MHQQFKIPKGWVIFLWIMTPPLIALFVWLMLFPFSFDLPLFTLFFFAPISLGMIALMVFGLIDAMKRRFIVDKDKITLVGIFRTRSLSLNEIKGYKQDVNYLSYIPKETDGKILKVPTYMGHYQQLMEWTRQNFTDLGVEELVKEEKEILANNVLGRTTEEREDKLHRTKKLAGALNIFALITGLATLFYPYFYFIQILLCCLIPVTGLIAYRTSKGLIKLDVKSNSAYPAIFTSLYIPSSALAIRALMDYNIFSYSNFWRTGIIVFLIVSFFMLSDILKNYDFKKGITYLTLFGLLLFPTLFAYGAVLTSNYIFDQGKPLTYKAEVLDKSISSGRTTRYYIKTGEWGPQTGTREVTVSKTVYEDREIGDSVTIYFNKGFFNIPYFIITE